MQLFGARFYFSIFALLFLLKLISAIAILLIGDNFFGGGNDSNYYHAYAMGDVDLAVNAWPSFLRWLNDLGLYSRGGVSFSLKVLSFIVIPFFVAKLTHVKASTSGKRIFWGSVVVISAYPTLFYLSTDIYRDVFMLFLWLSGLFVFKSLSQNPRLIEGLLLFIAGFLVSYILYEFRPYLGLGYFAALVFSPFYSFRRYPLFLSVFGGLAVLLALFGSGFLEPIIRYREGFEDIVSAGSNLGISFSSSTSFLPNFILSVFYQLFGFFVINFSSGLVFLVESVPFIIFFLYSVKNRKYSTHFVDYLILFFAVYSVVWLLGNDNLGTAVRLRMFSYIAIYIAFCIIYQNKIIASSKKGVEHI